MRHPRRTSLVPVIALMVAGALLLSCLTSGAQVTAPAPAAPAKKESALFRGLGVAYLTLGSADTAQTAYAMSQGGYREMNPILRPVAGRPVALGTLKMVVPLTFIYGTAQWYQKDPQSATAMRVIAVALQGFVVIWNARQLRAGRR
jgi:hypothetical protein